MSKGVSRSWGPALVKFTHQFQTFARDLESVLNHWLGYSQVG